MMETTIYKNVELLKLKGLLYVLVAKYNIPRDVLSLVLFDINHSDIEDKVCYGSWYYIYDAREKLLKSGAIVKSWIDEWDIGMYCYSEEFCKEVRAIINYIISNNAR